MHAAWAITVALLSASLLAQSAPPQCPADLPVDDIIAEIHRQQKKTRNKNPLPSGVCLGTWCLGGGKTPPTVPSPSPRDERPPAEKPGAEKAGTTGESSSKDSVDRCNALTELALEAAHNVEVGDYYVKQENYRAAFMRYQDAADQKPRDGAIHVRLGRALERLKDPARAVEQYEEALKYTPPQKWSDEASKALERLKQAPPQ